MIDILNLQSTRVFRIRPWSRLLRQAYVSASAPSVVERSMRQCDLSTVSHAESFRPQSAVVTQSNDLRWWGWHSVETAWAIDMRAVGCRVIATVSLARLSRVQHDAAMEAFFT